MAHTVMSKHHLAWRTAFPCRRVKRLQNSFLIKTRKYATFVDLERGNEPSPEEMCSSDQKSLDVFLTERPIRQSAEFP